MKPDITLKQYEDINKWGQNTVVSNISKICDLTPIILTPIIFEPEFINRMKRKYGQDILIKIRAYLSRKLK